VKTMSKLIKSAGVGAGVGAVVAAVMISLDQLGPFPVSVNSFLDRTIVRVCPFYILGFSKDVTSRAEWFLITIIGNAVIYGVLFALIAGAVALFRRPDSHKTAGGGPGSVRA
jgi:hypothetical protein